MGNDAEDTFHAGRLIARRLKASGIDTVFTLSGGHLFSLYDGCRSEGIRLVEGDTSAGRGGADRGSGRDERDERNGCGPAELVAAAGSGRPGARGAVGNGVPAGDRPCAIRGTADSVRRHRAVGRGGQRPDRRRAAGHGRSAIGGGVHRHSDGPRIFRRRRHRTARRPDHVAGAVSARRRRARPRGQPAGRRATTGHHGGHQRLVGSRRSGAAATGRGTTDPGADERHGPRHRARENASGLSAGTVPRARSKALGEADVAVVIGVPMDFRLGFGGVFGPDTQLIVADRVQPDRGHPRPVAAELYGDLSSTLTVLSDTPRADSTGHEEWIAELRATETAAREREHGELADDRSPLHPMRVYAELAPLLDRDAIIVVDAGDFGSYAGRVIDSYVPGAWLDSGPFGCLGSGPGYALAAKLA